MGKEFIKDDFDINSFKTVLVNTIVENNEIISILDKDYIDAGGGLLYTRIFPYLQNPKTVETTHPFICFKVDHVSNANYFVEEINVVVYVVCHEKGMPEKVTSYETGKTLSGIAVDILGEEIKKALVGLDTQWLGKLKCVSNTEEVLYYEYPSRTLTFSAKKESYGH